MSKNIISDKNTKKILYTGSFKFPNKDAAALRVHAIAKIFLSLDNNYDVSFAGWESFSQNNPYYEYDGFKCYSQSELSPHKGFKLFKPIRSFFRGSKTFKWTLKQEKFSTIILYNPPAFFSILMLFYSKISQKNLILDCTEWYEYKHLPGGRYGLAALEVFIRMRVVYPFFKNIICISRFLDHYFKNKNTVIIPPLHLKTEKPTPKLLDKDLNFIYAGSAGKKDQLAYLIKTLLSINTIKGHKIKIHIAGPDKFNFSTATEDINLESHNQVILHGLVSKVKLEELYSQAHFSFFLRENKRYALAGYPTKGIESLSHGTPVITNNIGDFGQLLSEQPNSILIDDNVSKENLKLKLEKIIQGNNYQ